MTGDNGFHLKEGRFRLYSSKNFFIMSTVKHQKSFPGRWQTGILRNIQYRGRWGSEQSDLVGDVPYYCRGMGLNDHQRPFPTQTMIQTTQDSKP